MAQIQLTVDDERGVLAVISRATSVHEAIETANLIARTAQGIRLVHSAAKEPPITERVGGAIPLPPGEQSAFACACGRVFYDKYEALGHVETDHASYEIRQDFDALEDTVEALITPSPLVPENWDSLPTISQEEFDAAQARNAK